MKTMATLSTTTVLGKRGNSHLVLRLSSSPAPSEAATITPTTEPTYKVDKKSRYLCTYPECTKSYSKPSRLAEHQRSHTGEVRIAVIRHLPRILILPLRSVRLHVVHAENPTCGRAIYRRTAKAICPNQRDLMCVRNLRNVRNASGPFNILSSTKILIEGTNLTLSVFFTSCSTNLMILS